VLKGYIGIKQKECAPLIGGKQAFLDAFPGAQAPGPDIERQRPVCKPTAESAPFF